MPNIFDILAPQMAPDPGGVPQISSPVDQPPVASPEQMQLADLFRRQQIQGPSEEEEELERLRKREDEIYARIMKGPRERQKEIAADIWRERYGLKETSGKGRRVAANLAEMLRSIGAGAKYESIPDIARDRATKEYTAEVGPLQREAATLSAAQKAAKAQADLQQHRREQLELQTFIQRYRASKSEAERAQIVAMTDPKVRKMAAETGLLEAKTDLTGALTAEKNLTNTALESTGGFKVGGQVSNALGMTSLGAKDPAQASNAMRTYQLLNRASARPGSLGRQTVEIPTIEKIKGIDPRTGRGYYQEIPSKRYARENIPGGVSTSFSEADFPWTKAADKQAPQVPPTIPVGAVTPAADGKVIIRSSGGAEYESSPSTAPKKFIGGQYRQPIDTSHAYDLARKFEIPQERFGNFSSQRFPDRKTGILRGLSDSSTAERAYRTSLEEMNRVAQKEFVNGNLDENNLGGLIGNFENTMKAYLGNLPMEAIQLRQLGVDVIGQKILALSGKAVTQREMDLYMKGLPNLAKDHPATTVAKLLQLQHMLSMRDYASDIRLTDPEVEKVYRTKAGAALASLPMRMFSAMEELRKARTSGNLKNFTIAGKTYTGVDASQALNQAAADVKKITDPKTIAILWKRALKEAGILDAIPLD